MIKVCLDPGHGGNDRYNKGPNGYIEADGVLKISRYLKEELEASGEFSVILTRNGDETVGLAQRGKIAANNGVDLFISQHTNAGPSSAGGTEVFYSVDLPGDRSFAENLSSAVADALGIKNRGAKTRESTTRSGEDYYTVIDVSQDGGVPHVLLIESAFHSNPEEEKLLLDDRMLKRIAEAQADVIYKFFGIPRKEKEESPEKPPENPPESPNPVPIDPNINANAVVQGDWLYARNSDGSIEPGRRIDIGDKIEVLDISDSKQLVFVKYPTPNGSRQAYVTNGPWIKYLNPYDAKVIPEKLDTRQTPGGQVIGSVFKDEKVTILKGQGNWVNIAYDTDKGKHTKSGWVEADRIRKISDIPEKEESKPTPTPSPVGSGINANAVVQGDWLYARRSDGSIEQGRRINIGDKIEVLDISYSKQLVLAKYPTPNGSRQAYVTNGPWIKYLNPYNGKVTAIRLNTRQTPGGQIIGSVTKGEKVTILQQQGDWINIAYDTGKGKHSKSGWVESRYISRL